MIKYLDSVIIDPHELMRYMDEVILFIGIRHQPVWDNISYFLGERIANQKGSVLAVNIQVHRVIMREDVGERTLRDKICWVVAKSVDLLPSDVIALALYFLI